MNSKQIQPSLSNFFIALKPYELEHNLMFGFREVIRTHYYTYADKAILSKLEQFLCGSGFKRNRHKRLIPFTNGVYLTIKEPIQQERQKLVYKAINLFFLCVCVFVCIEGEGGKKFRYHYLGGLMNFRLFRTQGGRGV